MEKALKLYNSKGAFPSTENQIEILGFKYDAKRMGGAPTISATVMYPTCLDNVWSDDVYVEFNGEKYYLNHTPTSSKSNEDERYKHEVTLVSERSLLDSIYFIDVAPSDGANQSPVTNSATFSFYGTIKEFAKRLNAAFEYSNLEYRVEIDKIVDTEEKLLSFDKQVLSAVLQESYNVFQVPYYFVGKKIYFDFFQSALPNTLKYGIDNELLSITKSNENFKIVNRCTGTGSAENIPYYYPNEHPLGKLKTLYNGAENSNLTIANEELFADNVKLHTNLVFTESVIDHITPDIFYYNYKDYDVWDKGHSTERYFYLGDKKWDKRGHWFAMPYVYEIREELTTNLNAGELIGYYKSFNPLTDKAWFNSENHAIAFKIPLYEALFKDGGSITFQHHIKDVNGEMQSSALSFFDVKYYILREAVYPNGKKQIYVEEINPMLGVTKDMFAPIYLSGVGVGRAVFSVFCEVWATEALEKELPITINFETSFKPSLILHEWRNEDNRIISLSDYGLHLSEEPNVGDNIKFELLDGFLIPFQKTLMPPIYISTKGNKRFYNALNNTYIDDNGGHYVFENEYSETKRREHIVEFPEIKPSIKNVVNANREHINSFIEFAYDYNDTDEIDSNGQYIHPYFFGKLRKINHSEQGFNLFDRASASGEMTISMTSGTCGACNFVVGVNENTRKNTVQVYEEDVIDSSGKILHKKGSLKRNDRGEVIYLGEAQEMQNNTIDNEVWIALKKDVSTYADVMPNAKFKYKPQACTKKADNSGYNEDGDTFVITNIIFPKSYLRAAEQELEKAIIQFMYENNVEKYSFSIKFSRIYFAEHPEILALLNENSFIRIEYNGETHSLYVNSITYKVDEKALPEITVELTKTLSASQSAIQTAITEVKTDVLDRIQKMDVAAMVANKFISKEHEDFAVQKITFNRGLNIGSQDEKTAQIDELGHAQLLSLIVKQFVKTPMFTDGFAGEGYQLWLDEKGYTNLTIDNITVRQGLKAFEFIIEKLRAVNGGLFLSAANGVIRTIEESEDGHHYLITFEGNNGFVAGDYMRCSVYSGIYITDYWVEIDSVEEGVAKIKKSEFGLSMPRIGQEVVLCGSRHTERQNAIHISASDDGQPRISIYNGISTKSLFGCLRTQLGNLDNIKDELLKPQGDGLYSDNAYLKGEFIVKSTGKSVDTMFAITEEGIKASVEQTQAEALKGKTLLYNASFIDGLKGWLTSNADSTYFSGASILFSSGSVLAQSVTVSNEPLYDNVFFVNIKNGWIKQSNLYFVNKPEFDAEKQYPLFFSTNIRCNESGVLNVCLTNIEASSANTFIGYSDGKYVEGDYIYVNLPNNNTSYALQLSEFGSIGAGDKIAVKIGKEPKLFNLTQGYEIPLTDWREEQISDDDVILSEPCNLIYTGKVNKTAAFAALDIDNLVWNGKGDFYLSFTGEADFYGLTIFTEKTEVRHKTFFDMSDRLINFGAQQLNVDGSIRQESGIVVQPEGAGLYAKDENGNQSRIATYADGKVVLEGSEIQLKGNLTSDGKFKVREDGSIEATNGSFNGYLINKPLKVTEDNYRDFFTDYNDDYTTAWTWKGWVLCSCVMLKYTSAMKNGASFSTVLTLPSIDARNVSATEEELDTIRSFIGQTITVYNDNDTGKTLVNYHKRIGTDTTDATRNMEAYSFATFTCSVSTDANGTEMIYWEEQAYGKIKTT